MSQLAKEDLDYISAQMQTSIQQNVTAALDDRHSDNHHAKEHYTHRRNSRCYDYYDDESGSSYDSESSFGYETQSEDDDPDLQMSASPSQVRFHPHPVKSCSLDELLQKFSIMGPQEESDPTTAPINDQLVEPLSKWLLGYVPPSEIRKLQDKVERPSNVLAAKPITVNPVIPYEVAFL